MSCACDNRKYQSDLERMRGLAKKAAEMEGRVYVIYRKNGVFGFVAEGEVYEGDFVEYVWY